MILLGDAQQELVVKEAKPMKKTILIVMVLVILSIGMVEGFLGGELVTCGDFSCATPSDFWSNLVSPTNCVNNFFVSASTLVMQCGGFGGSFKSNTSQDISFKAGRSYNVSIDFSFLTRSNATIFISDNFTRFVRGDGAGDAIVSFIAKPTINGNLTIEGSVSTSILSIVAINSISVKEILPVVDEYEWVTQVNKNGVTIHEVEVVIQPNKVKWLINQIERIIKILT